MVRVNVKIRVDARASLEVVAKHTNMGAGRAAQRTSTRIRGNIVSSGRVNTGAMLASTKARRDKRSNRIHPAYLVGPSKFYTKYQEFGTRAHGPVKAKALRFRPKGSGSFVYAKWVRGVTGAHFVQRALDDLTVADFLP